MSEQSQAILDAFLALPMTEQESLMARLRERELPEGEDPTDEELLEELRLRSGEIAQGTAGAVHWSEILKVE